MPTDLQEAPTPAPAPPQEPKQPGQEKKPPENKQEDGKPDAPKDDKDKAPPDPGKRRRTLLIAGVVVMLLAVGGALWYTHSQTYEDTDDAQIDGHLSPLASRVTGTIKAVYVEDNTFVAAGQSLVDLDTRDYEVALAQTRAQYKQAEAQLRGQQPNLPITVTSNSASTSTSEEQVLDAEAAVAGAEHDYATAVAQLRQAEANNAKAQNDQRRYKQLIDKGEVAQSDYDQYEAAAKADAAMVAAQQEAAASAAKTIDSKRAQLKQKEASLQQTLENAPRQVQIQSANIQSALANMEAIRAQLQQDELNISYCHIVAPVAGLVLQRSAEVGARISIGQQLMMLVETHDLWVTANFKETQLRRMRPGLRTTIRVDALDKTFEGYIESMPAATGDRTSALPPENATGNYVKIVQRLPTRIRFRPNQEALEALRPGMSVEPTVRF